MKNNVGDISFEESDKYSLPGMFFLFGATAFISPFVLIWMVVKTINEKKRIGDKNVHL